MGRCEEINGRAIRELRFFGKRLILFLSVAISTFGLTLFSALPEARGQGRAADLVWSSASGQGLTSVAYAPDGQTVFVGQSNRAASLWSASDGAALRVFAFNEQGCGTVNDVTYSPDSKIIAAISGCTARLFNPSDGTLIRKLNTGGGANAFHAATSLAFSPNGQLLATALVDRYPKRGTITLWNVLTGVQIWTASGGGGANVAFSPDGLTIASVGGKGLDLLRASDGTLIRNIPGPQKALAFSPDGTLVATAGLAGGEFPGDDTIEFYRVSDGTLVRKLTQTGKVTSVVFTPDGQGLVSSGYDDNQNAVNGFINATGTLHVWRLTDDALLKTYDKETGTLVPEVAVSPDGKFFLYPGGTNVVTNVNLARLPDISPAACAFSISPKTANHPCQGGTGSLTVTAPASCSWKAESRVDWIKVTSGASGTGTGTVNYTVASNDCNALPGSELTIDGLLIAAEQTFDVKQKLAPPLPPAAGVGTVIISEFRFHGPTPTYGLYTNGGRDEFIELYNNTDSPLIINTPDGSKGWSLVAADGTVILVLQNGFTLRPRGHYLFVLYDNDGGYTLAPYASLDSVYTFDNPDDGGVALFRTNDAANFTPENRVDAVGFNSVTSQLFREGVGLLPIGGADGQYSFVRRFKDGRPQDTNDNTADFVFVSTTGGSYGSAQSVLGAPGPENAGMAWSSLSVASPAARTDVAESLIEPSAAADASPNAVRCQTCVGLNAPLGTLSLRRRFTNNSNQTLTTLRFRVTDITTLNSPGYALGGPQADLRLLNSSDETVSPATASGVAAVKGTTLDEPPDQPSGGGLNTSVRVALPADGLRPGQSISVQFLLGVTQWGTHRFDVIPEALPLPPFSFDPTPMPTPTPDSTPTPTPTPTPIPTPTSTPESIPLPAPPVIYMPDDSPPSAERLAALGIAVKRMGDLSRPAAVEYATADGTAREGSDYVAAYGTLHFAAGEAEKSVTVLVIDDGYAEPDETFTLTLTNASGAQLGTPRALSLTIRDEDSGAQSNPVDDTAFFIRQHYLDFLGRDADENGRAFWSGGVESCGADAGCREVTRVNTSAAFFFSIESQETSYLVYRTYKAAYGDLPGAPVPLRREEFLPDTAKVGRGVVVGREGWQRQLEENKDAFALEFVTCGRFAEAYPAGMPAADFVAKLNANTGGALSGAEADALAAELSAAGNTNAARAATLRRVAENAELSRRELNRAFVLAQYFGYLRRNPNEGADADFSGYRFWLSKLEQFGGDWRAAEMVKAFLDSAEYRQRFGR